MKKFQNRPGIFVSISANSLELLTVKWWEIYLLIVLFASFKIYAVGTMTDIEFLSTSVFVSVLWWFFFFIFLQSEMLRLLRASWNALTKKGRRINSKIQSNKKREMKIDRRCKWFIEHWTSWISKMSRKLNLIEMKRI